MKQPFSTSRVTTAASNGYWLVSGLDTATWEPMRFMHSRLLNAMSERNQMRWWVGGAIVAVALLASGASVARLLQPAGTNTADPVIRISALFAAAAWWAGALAAISYCRPRQVEPTPWFRARRLLWTAGCLLVLLHIAVAMHAGHAWSHEAAFRHTETASGFGNGVFVNYAFAAIWSADVVAMWLVPTAYQSRPRWLGTVVHGFLAFIVFNATVIFAASPIVRAASLLFFAVLLWRATTGGRETVAHAPTQ